MENENIERIINEKLNGANKTDITPNIMFEIRKEITNEELAKNLNMDEKEVIKLLRTADNYKDEKWNLKRTKSTPTNECYMKHSEIIDLVNKNYKKKKRIIHK